MITSEQSLWFILLCILLASAYTFFFYRKDRQFFETKKWKILMLSAFRFISVFLISFLLISPMMKYLSEEIEKPILVFAMDNSESLVNNSDSAYIKNDFLNRLNEKFSAAANEKFEVVKYSFGEKIKQTDSFDFSEKQTNFSELFEELKIKYENRNLGAILVAGDGIYNKGKNPVYSLKNLKTPVYTIALGDTTTKKDALISDVKSNKIAFSGNKFPLQVEIKADKLKGKKTVLRIINNGKTVFTKPISYLTEEYSESIDAEITAETKGLQNYTVILEKLNGELISKNNRKTVVVDILDNKQKILLLANSPHPDLGAIRSVLEKQITYKVDVAFISDKKSLNIKAYDLLILHQLPSGKERIPQILSSIKKEKLPVLFVFGIQSDLTAFNQFTGRNGFKIKQYKKSFEESMPFLNPHFTIFESSEEQTEFLKNSAPLYTHFANYDIPTNAEIFLYQKMKGIETQKPLILFSKSDEDNRKEAYILGEGIWRWRLTDYNQNGNHKNFDALIGKTVQYLALKVKKERFMLNTERIYTENQHVRFQAQVYNESFEPTDMAEITLQLKDSADRIYNYKFNKPGNNKNKTFTLNTGILPVGEYLYSAKAKIENETFTKSGKLHVIPLDIETSELTANHKVLYQISELSKGKMFYKNELEKIPEALSKNQNISPIYHSNEKLLSFINFKWLFFIILGLFSVEWFLRKFYGSI